MHKKEVEKQMKTRFLILFLVLLMMPIANVFATPSSESVNLGDFRTQLASALNVSLFVAGLIASLILMLLVLFPSMMIAGYFGGSGAVLFTVIIVGLATSGVCMAIGWFPIWLYAIMCLAIAVMYGAKFANFGGGGQS